MTPLGRERATDRLESLNPLSDNQGVRGLIEPVRTKIVWKDSRHEK